MKNHMIRALSADGSLRASVALTTALVEETRQRQQTDPLATIALGRLVTAAALCGSLLKDKQRLALIVEGNGPLKKLFSESDACGRVCGSVKVATTGLSLQEKNFSVADAVGRAGFLHVVKDLGLKEPYRGLVQLQSSEIAEDLAYYFTASEQTPSSVGLGVNLGSRGETAAAGGFLIQALPGCDDGILIELENRLRTLPPVTALLLQGKTPEGILEAIFEGIPFKIQGSTELMFHCSCSRGRTRNALISLGKQGLKKLVEEQGGATVSCEFCKKDYAFGKVELQRLIENL